MKMKSKIKRLLLLLIIFSIVTCNIKWPRLSKKYVVNEFIKNKHYFDVVKDYMLAQDPNYYISKSYKEEIVDEKVKEAITYIFERLKFGRIYNVSNFPHDDSGKDYYLVAFLKTYPIGEDFGIVYTNNPNRYGMIMELIEENWYYHWMGWGF